MGKAYWRSRSWHEKLQSQADTTIDPRAAQEMAALVKRAGRDCKDLLTRIRTCDQKLIFRIQGRKHPPHASNQWLFKALVMGLMAQMVGYELKKILLDLSANEDCEARLRALVSRAIAVGVSLRGLVAETHPHALTGRKIAQSAKEGNRVRYGTPEQKTTLGREQVRAVLQLQQQSPNLPKGKAIKRIADRFNCSDRTIRRRLKQFPNG